MHICVFMKLWIVCLELFGTIVVCLPCVMFILGHVPKWLVHYPHPCLPLAPYQEHAEVAKTAHRKEDHGDMEPEIVRMPINSL